MSNVECNKHRQFLTASIFARHRWLVLCLSLLCAAGPKSAANELPILDQLRSRQLTAEFLQALVALDRNDNQMGYALCKQRRGLV